MRIFSYYNDEWSVEAAEKLHSTEQHPIHLAWALGKAFLKGEIAQLKIDDYF